MKYKTEEEKLFSGDYISKNEIKKIFDKYIEELSKDAAVNDGNFELVLVLRDIAKELKL